jgi:hypothetical protein
MALKLRYETGIATLIQFIAMMMFGFVNGLVSVIDDCHSSGFSECAPNTVVSFAYILLLAGWFGFLAMLGYAAQDQRSHKIARVLIVAELLVLMIAIFNARHHPSIFELLTSLTDAALAIWVILLAFRLSRARGGRIVAKQQTSTRPRRRVSAKKSDTTS